MLLFTLVDSVHVHLPHIVDAFMNVTVEVVLADDCWGNQPEHYVVSLQLEDSYKTIKVRVHDDRFLAKN